MYLRTTNKGPKRNYNRDVSKAVKHGWVLERSMENTYVKDDTNSACVALGVSGQNPHNNVQAQLGCAEIEPKTVPQSPATRALLMSCPRTVSIQTFLIA